MPLIDTSSPEVELQEAREVLRGAGLFTKRVPRNDLSELLESNSLGADRLIESLGSIAHNSENDSLRLRAIETGLKLNPETRAAMREADAKEAPIVNIIIHGNDAVNPILIPRKVA